MVETFGVNLREATMYLVGAKLLVGSVQDMALIIFTCFPQKQTYF